LEPADFMARERGHPHHWHSFIISGRDRSWPQRETGGRRGERLFYHQFQPFVCSIVAQRYANR
jgi:hypothetical protein